NDGEDKEVMVGRKGLLDIIVGRCSDRAPT
ncbi:hypothetical protein AC249_AIPGENE8803, partial [Exaiptasia diaphana]